MSASISYLFNHENDGDETLCNIEDGEQLQLFSNSQHEIGKVYFCSIDDITESDLKRWVVVHHMCGIIDLRQNPVFEYPYFDHVAFFDFLEKQHVHFLSGYRIFSRHEEVRKNWKASRLSAVKNILRSLSQGSALVLFGNRPSEQEVLGDFRKFFSDAIKRQGSMKNAIEKIQTSLNFA